MRKIKTNESEKETLRKKEETLKNINFEKENEKYIKLVLLISWIIPFFGLMFMHFSRKKMPEKPKKIMCQIINLNYTTILVLFILVSILNTLIIFKVSEIIVMTLFLIVVILFLTSIIYHLIGTLKILKNEDFHYRYIAEFFKPYKNID